MKIECIELENIRSHIKTCINFGEGFNCLIGGLGTGKSSILYAIDFAFFGEPISRSYDYLLREEAEYGKVTLKFFKNGKEYVIQRALKRQNERISQNMEQLTLKEEGNVIAEMKSEAVAEQLFSIIGFDKEIFREILWMRQEHLKDVLNMSPIERQKKLDQLFNLSDYEIAWINFRPVITGLEKELTILQRDADVTGFEEIMSRHQEALKELEIKEKEAEETKKMLFEAEERYNRASERLKTLETIRRTNEQLRREESILQSKYTGIQQSNLRLAEEIQKRKERLEDLEKRLEVQNSQIRSCQDKLRDVGLPPELSIEKLLDFIKTLQVEIQGNLGKEESLKSDISKATARISNLIKENTCPLCLQILEPSYKERLIQRLYDEISENKQQLTNIEKMTEKHENVRSVIETVIQNFQNIQARVEEITRQMGEEKKILEDTKRRLEQSQKDEKMFEDELVSLRSKIREFDITDLENAQKEFNVAYEEYSSLKHKSQNIELSRSEIIRRLQTVEERLKIAQQKKARLEKVDKMITHAQEIRQAYRSIQPRIRTEFVRYLERIVQQVLNELSSVEGLTFSVKIDENYTPIIEVEKGYERSIFNLSGGERTLLAFAYRIGLGQLIMQWKVGHGLPLLLLDEPTESLGREDGSIDRLAESLSRLKTVEQIIAVSHNENFADKADHVIRLEKLENRSVTSIER
ncbi:SMC family ATPase [Candidatus Bathyarchaeota archaeon]|nr:SMC family ATPase [Candidatus Bathyarchaeota archaeon]